MSPEQFEGARSIDERADVYACRVIPYYARSGRRPFEADSYTNLVCKILTSDPGHFTNCDPSCRGNSAT